MQEVAHMDIITIMRYEIWFVLHKSQTFNMMKNQHWHYQHFIAVFDTNMNLLRYSELFKLGEHPMNFV